MTATATETGITNTGIPARTILVVEDEILIRTLVCEYLRLEGHDVIEAACADDALNYLSAHNHVALIFSDIRMPGSMNGIDFLQRVQRDRPEIKLILTSAHFASSELPAGMGNTIVFIQKPYMLSDVAARIQAALPASDPESENGRSSHIAG